MNHKLSLKAATLYSTLLAEFVDDNDFDGFSEVFEKFLDAYDADIKAEKYPKTISKVWYPTANEQRDIPKVGEIYRDSHDNRFKIYEVTGKIVAIEFLPVDGKELFPLRFLPIEFFSASFFTKEDKLWHA